MRSKKSIVTRYGS